MQQVKWFERRFDFQGQQNIMPSILERLSGTPLRLEAKLSDIPHLFCPMQWEDSWSIQENIGHLTDLEPLWQGRLQDILDGATYLRSWDLSNQKTALAGHNERSVDELLADFRAARAQTVAQLGALSEKDVFKAALHPRLEQPMRNMDLFLFVAEHDDHHLARITQLHRLIAHRFLNENQQR